MPGFRINNVFTRITRHTAGIKSHLITDSLYRPFSQYQLFMNINYGISESFISICKHVEIYISCIVIIMRFASPIL